MTEKEPLGRPPRDGGLVLMDIAKADRKIDNYKKKIQQLERDIFLLKVELVDRLLYETGSPLPSAAEKKKDYEIFLSSQEPIPEIRPQQEKHATHFSRRFR